MIEFWLTFNNREEALQLPVPPPEFTIQEGNSITVININSFGEISIIGKDKISVIEISSFFPNQPYSFCQYFGFPPPYDCVRMIRKWRQSGKPIRLIITDTDINMACVIEDFRYGERDATGDIYFTLTLKEYRFIQAKKTSLTSSTATAKRPSEKSTPKTYAVKSDDTLYLIAKKVYGDGAQYTTLASQNNIKPPYAIKAGQVLKV